MIYTLFHVHTIYTYIYIYIYIHKRSLKRKHQSLRESGKSPKFSIQEIFRQKMSQKSNHSMRQNQMTFLPQPPTTSLLNSFRHFGIQKLLANIKCLSERKGGPCWSLVRCTNPDPHSPIILRGAWFNQLVVGCFSLIRGLNNLQVEEARAIRHRLRVRLGAMCKKYLGHWVLRGSH